MHRIEIIHLRANGVRSVKAAKDALQQALKNEIAPFVKIYQHQSIEADMCVVLSWNSAEMAGTRCDLGLHLTSALKEFGRVDHSVWVEG